MEQRRQQDIQKLQYPGQAFLTASSKFSIMKITVFVIIMGISSCFVDTQSLCGRRGNLKEKYAVRTVAHFVDILDQFDQMKNKNCSSIISCFWYKIFYLMNWMATLTRSPYETIIQLAVSCLPCKWKEHTAVIKALRYKQSELLKELGFTEDDMMSTMICAENKVLSSVGYSVKNILEEAKSWLPDAMWNFPAMVENLLILGHMKLDLGGMTVVNVGPNVHHRAVCWNDYDRSWCCFRDYWRQKELSEEQSFLKKIQQRKIAPQKKKTLHKRL